MTQLDLSSDFETHTAFHFRNLAESDPSSYGATIVRQRLGELGVGLMLIPNQAAYDLSGGTVAAHPLWHPDLTHYTRQTIEVPLGSTQGIQVIRARVQTPTELEAIHGLDVLNGPKLREIGASKWRQYQLAGEYMPQTIVADETLPRELAAITGQRLVVKADTSQLSRDCHIIAREEVTQTVTVLREELQARPNRKSSDIIVQAFAPGEKWSELRGRTEYAQNLLNVAESEEVRVYCFVSDQDSDLPVQAKYYATGRAFYDDKDKWIEIDQESVPGRVWDIADTVAGRLLQAANVRGGYFAIDFIKSTLSGSTEQEILIREINTRDPMMVTEEEGVNDTRIQRHMLAELMARLAKRA